MLSDSSPSLPFDPFLGMLAVERSKRSLSPARFLDGASSAEDGKRRRHCGVGVCEATSLAGREGVNDAPRSSSPPVLDESGESSHRQVLPTVPSRGAGDENANERAIRPIVAALGSPHSVSLSTAGSPLASSEYAGSLVGAEEANLSPGDLLSKQLTLVSRPLKPTSALSQEEWMQMARLKPKVEGVCFDRFFKRWVAKRAGMKKVYFPVYKYGFDLAYDLAVRTRRGQEIDPSLDVPAFVPAGPRRPRKPLRPAATHVAREEKRSDAGGAARQPPFRARVGALRLATSNCSSAREAEERVDAWEDQTTSSAVVCRLTEAEKPEAQRTPERCTWRNIRWSTSGGETSIESAETLLSSNLSIPRTSACRQVRLERRQGAFVRKLFFRTLSARVRNESGFSGGVWNYGTAATRCRLFVSKMGESAVESRSNFRCETGCERQLASQRVKVSRT